MLLALYALGIDHLSSESFRGRSAVNCSQLWGKAAKDEYLVLWPSEGYWGSRICCASDLAQHALDYLANLPKAQPDRHSGNRWRHGKRIDVAGLLKLKERPRNLEILWTESPGNRSTSQEFSVRIGPGCCTITYQCPRPGTFCRDPTCLLREWRG